MYANFQVFCRITPHNFCSIEQKIAIVEDNALCPQFRLQNEHNNMISV